ncbi:MAG: hypothetical protein M1818_000612 [Claussenomyces sp. TS43310]|nr:MAG: hypothetical protein M1818_000612 [Claussenomyces sp. TS43310]
MDTSTDDDDSYTENTNTPEVSSSKLAIAGHIEYEDRDAAHNLLKRSELPVYSQVGLCRVAAGVTSLKWPVAKTIPLQSLLALNGPVSLDRWWYVVDLPPYGQASILKYDQSVRSSLQPSFRGLPGGHCHRQGCQQPGECYDNKSCCKSG